MIDNNRDGTIDAADLKGTYASLGIMNVEDEMVNSMIKEAPAALTFTVFLGSISKFDFWPWLTVLWLELKFGNPLKVCWQKSSTELTQKTLSLMLSKNSMKITLVLFQR